MIKLTKPEFYDRLKNLNPDQFITGNNFAKKADFVYSEAVSEKDFEEINKKNITYSKIQQNIYIYKKKNIQVKENDIIYCKTDAILELFSKIENFDKLRNLKLITHQGAIPSIEKKLFSLKPKCISEWYSVNVSIERDNLYPIPLGLGNSFSDVGLHPIDFLNLYSTKKAEDQVEKIYSNFRSNTNPIREDYLKSIKRNKFFIHQDSGLSKQEYLNNLLKYKYILSPKGLGIDTHRFWEVLYSGSFPVANNDYLYKYFRSYYQEFQNIDELDINNFKNLSHDETLVKLLNIDYWIGLMKKNNIESKQSASFNNKIETFKKRENKIKKSYVRFKIIKTKSSIKYKLMFYYRTFKNFDNNLFNRFWHIDY